MKKLFLIFLLVCVCTTGAFSAILSNKSSSPVLGNKFRPKLGIGIDTGWPTSGIIARYNQEEGMTFTGKLGYEYGVFGKDYNPVDIQFELTADYTVLKLIFNNDYNNNLEVAGSVGASLLLPKPFGIAPEVGIVTTYNFSSCPISIFLRTMYGPGFYFNVTSDDAFKAMMGRFNTTLGFTYNFDIKK